MKAARFIVVIVTLMLGWCDRIACGSSRPPVLAQFASVHTDLVGTWEYEGGDGGGQQKITLTLRKDGSYTKTLDATVQGVQYGGTHSGTWTLNGMFVHLSGDGNWPPYSHNLSTFRRL